MTYSAIYKILPNEYKFQEKFMTYSIKKIQEKFILKIGRVCHEFYYIVRKTLVAFKDTHNNKNMT